MADLDEAKRLELWKAFHADGMFGQVYNRAMEERMRLGLIQTFYDTDDIFRREIDFLKQKMAKKKMKVKDVEKAIGELLKEAEYRRYIATFDNMQKNYDARRAEMSKIDDAMKI